MVSDRLNPSADLTSDSTAYPCLSDFERRFSKTASGAVKSKSAPTVQKHVTEGEHMCLTVKNPRTLVDLMDWAHRDLFEFAA